MSTDEPATLLQRLYGRAVGLYLALNLLFIFALALPPASMVSHVLREWFSMPGILAVWGLISLLHMLLTLMLIPKFAAWLARKDVERAAKQRQATRT